MDLRLSTIEADHVSGRWNHLPAQTTARYCQILRTLGHSRSAALPETKVKARQIMQARGIAPRSAVVKFSQRASAHDVIDRQHHEARVAGMVKRQRAKILEKLRLADLVTIDGGAPTVVQAAEELIAEREVELISDEMVRQTRGAMPANEVKRRERRVIVLGTRGTAQEDMI